jgi:hypothetical protein
MYVTGYTTKGGQSSAQYKKTFMSLLTTSVNAQLNHSTSNIVGKYVHKVVGKKSVSKPEALFLLSRGSLVTSSFTTKSISINTRNITKVATNPNAETDPKELKKDAGNETDVDKYTKNKAINTLSFYNWYAAKVSPAIPIFSGVDRRLNWPISESFAESMCFLHIPFNKSIKTLLEKSYPYVASDDDIGDHTIQDRPPYKFDNFKDLFLYYFSHLPDQLPVFLISKIKLKKSKWKNAEILRHASNHDGPTPATPDENDDAVNLNRHVNGGM